MRLCSIENCEKKHYAKGYCLYHYDKLLRRGYHKLYMRRARKSNPKYKKYQKEYDKKTKILRPWIKTYAAMWHRCNSPKCNSYAWYHKKGIKLLMKLSDLEYLWYRDKAYNLKQPSIDRIDNNGHYEVSNCRYIELRENLNRRGF